MFTPRPTLGAAFRRPLIKASGPRARRRQTQEGLFLVPTLGTTRSSPPHWLPPRRTLSRPGIAQRHNIHCPRLSRPTERTECNLFTALVASSEHSVHSGETWRRRERRPSWPATPPPSTSPCDTGHGPCRCHVWQASCRTSTAPPRLAALQRQRNILQMLSPTLKTYHVIFLRVWILII